VPNKQEVFDAGFIPEKLWKNHGYINISQNEAVSLLKHNALSLKSLKIQLESCKRLISYSTK